MVKFLYGAPRYTPEEFFNYEELLLLSDYVRDRRQPYMMVGPRRTGKTSLLHVLSYRLRREGVLTSFIDLEAGRGQGFLTPISLSRIYSFAVIDDYLEQMGLMERVRLSAKKLVTEAGAKVVSGLSRLLGRVEEVGGKLGGAIDVYVKLHVEAESAALERRPYLEVAERVLGEALDLPERLGEDSDRTFVVMVDEFQYVRDLKQALPGIFHIIRNRYQSHRRVGYVVSGSAIGLVTDMVASKDQPFYGFFLVQNIRPFSEETSIRFLREGYKSEGLMAPLDVLKNIVRRCDGLPAWLNYVGLDSSRVARASGRKTVSLDVAEKTFRRMMSDPGVTGALERDLRALEREVRSRRIVETLRIICLADKPVTASEVWSALREEEGRPLPQPKAYQYLKRLADFGFVERTEEGAFRCIDPIVKEYLKGAYRRR